MSVDRIPPERPHGLIDAATVPEQWLIDEAWRPGKTWLTEILEADPDVWSSRLVQIVNDVQLQLAQRNADARARRMERDEFAELQQWRRRAIALLGKTMARGRDAKALAKQAHVTASAAGTELHKIELRRAIAEHRAASEAAAITPEAHDLVLWAVLEGA